MAEPIAEGGREAGICGHDGTDWIKVKVDDEGKLQIDIDTSALPSGAATAANQVTMITALQLIDDLRNALDSVGTDEIDVNVESSVLPSGAATDTVVQAVRDRIGALTSPAAGSTNKLLTDALTALQLIDDLRGALAAVAGDQLRVDLIANDVDAGVRHGDMEMAVYDGVLGDTDYHTLISASGSGVLIGLDLVSDHPDSRVRITLDGEYLYGPRATAPQMAIGQIISDVYGSGGESCWADVGVYDTDNDYYSLYLKREICYNSSLLVEYRAGTDTADLGVAAQHRPVT